MYYKTDEEYNRDVKQTIGKNIKRLREHYDLTSSELSAKVRLTNSAVYQYETGRAMPRMRTLANLADALHVQIDVLFMDPSVLNEQLNKQISVI